MGDVRELVDELKNNEKRIDEIRDELKDVPRHELESGNLKFYFSIDKSSGKVVVKRIDKRQFHSEESEGRVYLDPDIVDELVKWLSDIGYISIERLVKKQLSGDESED